MHRVSITRYERRERINRLFWIAVRSFSLTSLASPKREFDAGGNICDSGRTRDRHLVAILAYISFISGQAPFR